MLAPYKLKLLICNFIIYKLKILGDKRGRKGWSKYFSAESDSRSRSGRRARSDRSHHRDEVINTYFLIDLLLYIILL